MAGGQGDQKIATNPAARFAGLETIPLQVHVKVGAAKCRLGRLSELKAGDLIRLDRRIGEPLELCACGVLLARVDAVAHGQGVGVKIVEIPESHDDGSV